ncbi:MAG: TerB family tellurite resistance protein, partial [Polyangiaceae bacterium]
MHEQDMAIVKALVPVAWADNVYDAKEKETIEALLEAFDATDDEKKELRDYAAERKTIDDINLQDLSADDRRLLLQHAVLLTFVDGEQGEEEKAFLVKFVEKLKLPDEEAKELVEIA